MVSKGEVEENGDMVTVGWSFIQLRRDNELGNNNSGSN